MAKGIKDKVVIIGMGCSKFGERWDKEADNLMVEAYTELDRALAAYAGDRIVGTAGIFTFDVSVPGGQLPAAGVTMVGVHPTHRRRGILTAMMRAQFSRRSGTRDQPRPTIAQNAPSCP